MNYIVKVGDTLSKIARDTLGDITLWQDLAKHNKIANPNLIKVGQVINLDIPKRTVIDITDSRNPILINQSNTASHGNNKVLDWFAGFALSVLAALTVKKILQEKGKQKK